MEDWVLADTLIWASFFSKPNSAEKHAVDDLIDADRVVLIGPIVAEVLLGFRRKAQADWVASRLRATHFLETTWDDWKSAAEIGRELAAKGHRIPITEGCPPAGARPTRPRKGIRSRKRLRSRPSGRAGSRPR
jgi:predicted nucleic acid-binding protein